MEPLPKVRVGGEINAKRSDIDSQYQGVEWGDDVPDRARWAEAGDMPGVQEVAYAARMSEAWKEFGGENSR